MSFFNLIDSTEDDDCDYKDDNPDEPVNTWTSAEVSAVDIAHSNGGRARCVNCLKLKPMHLVRFGSPASRPLEPAAFYCVDCANELGVGDYDPTKGSKYEGTD